MTRWLEHFTPRPQAALRLYCFPYAGGAALIYRHWGKKLPEEVEVCPVQLPGRWGRISEPPFRDLDSLVLNIREGLREEITKPYILFGHSMGALIAFELARLLQGEKVNPPRLLVVSAAFAPQRASRPQPTFGLPDGALIQRIRELNGTPEEILQNSVMLQTFLPILRADLEMAETYRFIPGEKLCCPILALGGEEDPEVNLKEMEGWAAQTEKSFTLKRLPGGHFFLHDQADQILQVLKNEIKSLRLA